MTARLAHIVRHPVKAAGWEELAAADLAPGRCLPFDRLWAVATDGARLEEGWGPKRNFLRGAAAPELNAVRASFDAASGRLTLSHPERGSVTGDPDAAVDAARIVDWLRPLWPATRPAPAALVRAAAQPFTDTPMPYLSLHGLASQRAVAQAVGRDLSIHRWRGNLWLDGLAPFEEFDMVGRTIRIGGAELAVESRIDRCQMPNGNPETGRADADMLAVLESRWGHGDFGVFATVVEGGSIAPGDEVRT